MADVRPAVVLLSGGLDSATVLAVARRDGFCCHALSFSYGQDPGASNLAYLSWALWHLGYPAQAVERGRAALALAQALAHPHTLAQVSNYLALTHFFCRDWRAAKTAATRSCRPALIFSRSRGSAEALAALR